MQRLFLEVDSKATMENPECGKEESTTNSSRIEELAKISVHESNVLKSLNRQRVQGRTPRNIQKHYYMPEVCQRALRQFTTLLGNFCGLMKQK